MFEKGQNVIHTIPMIHTYTYSLVVDKLASSPLEGNIHTYIT